MMKQLRFVLSFLTYIVLGTTGAKAQVPVQYYAFKAGVGYDAAPTFSVNGGSAISGIGLSLSATSGHYTGSDDAVNAAGWANGLTDPGATAASYIQFTADLSGFAGVSATVDTRPTGLAAPRNLNLLYSTDGVTFTPATAQTNLAVNDWGVVTFDLSGATALDDAPNVTFRLYAFGSVALADDDVRFDNLTLSATTVTASTTLADYTAIDYAPAPPHPVPTFGDLAIDGPGITVQLGSDLRLNGSLQLDEGVIAPGGAHLILESTASVVGGSAASHVAGSLTREGVGAGATVFPVGTGVVYAPVTIADEAASDDFTASVQAGITPALAQAGEAVQLTWTIDEASPGGSASTVALQWPGAVEGASFQRDGTVDLYRYDTGAGQWSVSSGASVGGSDPYVATSNGTTDAFGAFTVVSQTSNGIPVAVDDAASTDEDTAIDVDVLANDSDVDGDALTVTQVSDPVHGAASINAGGSVHYVPDADFNGQDAFSYTVSDGNGGTDEATVTVTVNAINDAPVAGDDSATTDEDVAVNVDVLGNDTDADADALTVTQVSDPLHGTTSIAADGTVHYVPDPDFNGQDAFSYTVSDGNGGTDEATVTVTVNAINDAPVAGDDSATTDEDVAVNVDVLGNDTDADGDALTVTQVSDPVHGVTSINANGTVHYVPDPDFNGQDAFDYVVADGNGGEDQATVVVTVSAVNDGPVAVDDAATTPEDSPVNVDVLANDTDADGDALAVTQTSGPAHGSVAANPDGTLRYVPDADFNGADSFSYTASDGHGGTDQGTVRIDVSPVNDAPVALDDAEGTDEDTPLDVDVLVNDTDADGDALTVTSVTAAAHGVVSINADGTVRYAPVADFFGQDTFDYAVADGNGAEDQATVTVTINPVNDAPIVANAIPDQQHAVDEGAFQIDLSTVFADPDGDALTFDATSSDEMVATASTSGTVLTVQLAGAGSSTIAVTADDGHGGAASDAFTLQVNEAAPGNAAPVAADDEATTPEDTAVLIVVLANDTDADGDALTITSVSSPAHGTVSVMPEGTIRYTPATDFNGADTFTYTVTDGKGGTDTAAANVTVEAVNDPPAAADDTTTTAEDTAVVIDVVANDDDVDGDAVTVSQVGTPANGTASIDTGGAIAYRPNANLNGQDTFGYTITDGNGGTDAATVTVTIEPVNDLPVAADDAVETAEGVAVSVDVLANDLDVDGDALAVSQVTDPAHAVTSINADGTVRYAPDAGFAGDDSFTYTVTDGQGGTGQATVTVTVQPANDPPVALDDAAGTVEDTPFDVDVLANDADADGDALTVTTVTTPAHGTASINPDGSIRYAPAADYNGQDAFAYTAADGNGGEDQATVTVTIDPVNDAPVVANAIPDQQHTVDEGAFQIDLSTVFSDVDGDALSYGATSSDEATASVSTSGALLTVQLAGAGSSTLAVAADDGHGGTVADTFALQVNAAAPGNAAPVASADAATTPEDTAVLIDVLANDADADGDALTITSVSSPMHGTVSVMAGGGIQYAPAANFNGVDGFTYTLSDGNGGNDEGTVTVTVSAVNDPPVAVADTATSDEDVPVVIAVRSNDRDVDGDALSIESVTAPAHGTATILSTGDIRYSPARDYAGHDAFSYVLADGKGGTASAMVSVDVRPVNDAPTFVTAPVRGAVQGQPYRYVVRARDVDGDAVLLSAPALPAWLGFQDHGDGTATLTGIPKQVDVGVHTVAVEASDGSASVTQSFSLIVDEMNDAPVARDDTVSVAEDTAVLIPVLDNDTDADGDILTVAEVLPPMAGVAGIVSGDSIRYVPDPDFNGSDSFVYVVDDGKGGVDSAYVQVTVTPVNDAPVFVTQPVVEASAGAEYRYLVRAADVDVDRLLLSAGPMPAWLSLVEEGNGEATLSGTPSNEDAGGNVVRLIVDDGTTTAEQLFEIQVVADVAIRPTDGAAGVATQAIFEWRPIQGAETYRLQLAGADGFGDDDQPQAPVLDVANLYERTYEVDAGVLSEGSVYVWRVRGVTQGEEGPWMHEATFTTKVAAAVPEAPILLTPDDDATDVTASPELAWEPVARSTTYDVQVASDDTFATLVVDSSGVEMERLQVTLDAAETYYWHVRARNAAGAGPWSSTFSFSTATNVGTEDESVPATFALAQNYPNPFNPSTTIGYALPEAGRVRLRVFDVQGRLVATLVDSVQPAGGHDVRFDAAGLASGVYLYRLETTARSITRRMTLLR